MSGLSAVVLAETCAKTAVAAVVQFARCQHTAWARFLLAWDMASLGHPMCPSVLPGDLQASEAGNCLANAATPEAPVGLLLRNRQASRLVLQSGALSAVLIRPC